MGGNTYDKSISFLKKQFCEAVCEHVSVRRAPHSPEPAYHKIRYIIISISRPKENHGTI